MPMPDGTPTPEEQAAKRARGAAPGAPGSFVNFSRRFNANRDVAQQQAQKYASQAAGAAGAAQQSTAAAQNKFSTASKAGVTAGTNVGDAANAQQQMGPPPAAPPAPVASQSAGLVSESTRPEAGTGVSAAQATQLANRTYSGPDGLDDQQAAVDAEKAQQQLTGIGSAAGVQTLVNEGGPSGSVGADRLSGALIGRAGRKEFDALRARFNPNKELIDAQAKAVEEAKKAREESAKHQDEWSAIAGEKGDAEAKNAEIQAARDAGAQERAAANQVSHPVGSDANNKMYGVDPNNKAAVAKRQAEIDSFSKAFRATDDIHNQGGDFVRDVINAGSPSQWVAEATGNRNPLGDSFTEKFHAGGGSASGSTHGDQIPWSPSDFWVWRSMTPQDWTDINRLPHERQKGWIAARKDTLIGQQKARTGSVKGGG